MKTQTILVNLFFFTILVSLLSLTSCNEDDSNSSKVVYRSPSFSLDSVGDGGQSLNIENYVWEVIENSQGNEDVFLSLKGDITGDKILVQTYGDGLIGDLSLSLDEDKAFNEVCQIYFTQETIDVDTLILFTNVSIILEADTMFVELRDTLTDEDLQ